MHLAHAVIFGFLSSPVRGRRIQEFTWVGYGEHGVAGRPGSEARGQRSKEATFGRSCVLFSGPAFPIEPMQPPCVVTNELTAELHCRAKVTTAAKIKSLAISRVH